MTVEAAGLWELGWSAPITESTQWEMVMREFGVERLNMTPISGINKRWVHEYASIEDLLEDRSHLTPVFIDENGTTELSEFEHPEDALYVFGKGTYSPFSNMASKFDAPSIRIDTTKPGLLWPHQALGIVLYMRGRA